MTQEQFDKIGWTGGMKAVYKNTIYDISSVCFEEKLIGIVNYCMGSDDDTVHWARCENVEIEISEF